MDPNGRVIKFKDLPVTTITMLVEFNGNVNNYAAHFLFPITPVWLPPKSSRGSSITIPHYPIPGKILAARNEHHFRGIKWTTNEKYFENCVPMCISAKRANIKQKLLISGIHMCGPKSVDEGLEAAGYTVNHLKAVQQQIDYCRNNYCKFLEAIEWFINATRGVNARRYYDRPLTPDYILSIPDKIPGSEPDKLSLYASVENINNASFDLAYGGMGTEMGTGMNGGMDCLFDMEVDDGICFMIDGSPIPRGVQNAQSICSTQNVNISQNYPGSPMVMSPAVMSPVSPMVMSPAVMSPAVMSPLPVGSCNNNNGYNNGYNNGNNASNKPIRYSKNGSLDPWFEYSPEAENHPYHIKPIEECYEEYRAHEGYSADFIIMETEDYVTWTYPSFIPPHIDERMAEFLTQTLDEEGTKTHGDIIKLMDSLRFLPDVCSYDLNISGHKIYMVNYNFSLGWLPDRGQFDILFNCVDGFACVYNNDVSPYARIICPYELTEEEIRTRKPDANHHVTFLVYRSGKITQIGPGGKRMEDAYNRFMSVVVTNMNTLKLSDQSPLTQKKGTSRSKSANKLPANLGYGQLGYGQLGYGQPTHGQLGFMSAVNNPINYTTTIHNTTSYSPHANTSCSKEYYGFQDTASDVPYDIGVDINDSLRYSESDFASDCASDFTGDFASDFTGDFTGGYAGGFDSNYSRDYALSIGVTG